MNTNNTNTNLNNFMLKISTGDVTRECSRYEIV